MHVKDIFAGILNIKSNNPNLKKKKKKDSDGFPFKILANNFINPRNNSFLPKKL